MIFVLQMVNSVLTLMNFVYARNYLPAGDENFLLIFCIQKRISSICYSARYPTG